ITPLKKTLQEFVDFKNLKDPSRPRLIVTSTDIQNGKPSIFDSMYDNINADHVIASAGYPFYGISWTIINDKYLWDGTLLSNTPLTEVIHASPKRSKKVYLVDLFPHHQEEIPKNMIEAWHRARDIMQIDKTNKTVRLSKTITQYLELLQQMYDILVELFDSGKLDETSREKFKKVEPEYYKLADERGALIKDITRIERHERMHFLFEDADFSLCTIKQLISNGEKDAEKVLSAKS
ncbi:MAG: patatin-like phospholipase family protein, partial [Nitrosotalea sp.]